MNGHGWVAPWDDGYQDPTGEDGRDYRFSLESDAAIARVQAGPEGREGLATLWGVAPEVVGLLLVGRREDQERRGKSWAGTGRWAWVVPLASGRGRCVGLLRIYAEAGAEARLVSGSRHGLILPEDFSGRRGGPILACHGPAETAAGLARVPAPWGCPTPEPWASWSSCCPAGQGGKSWSSPEEGGGARRGRSSTGWRSTWGATGGSGCWTCLGGSRDESRATID